MDSKTDRGRGARGSRSARAGRLRQLRQHDVELDGQATQPCDRRRDDIAGHPLPGIAVDAIDGGLDRPGERRREPLRDRHRADAAIGKLNAGNFLVSNFNDKANDQGTGTTIDQISPSGQQTPVRIDQRQLSAGPCPGGVGLTTALSILPVATSSSAACPRPTASRNRPSSAA